MSISPDVWRNGQSTSPDSLAYLELMDKTVQYTTLFKELIKPQPGERILDAGAGRGTLATDLAQENPQSSIYGCDISSIAMNMAFNQIPPDINHQPTFFVADIESGELPEAFYDTIYTSRLMQHLNHPLAGLKTFQRALVPGGRLILAEPSWYSLKFIDQSELTTQFQQVIYTGNYIKHPYLAPTLNDLLSISLGFRSVNSIEKTDLAVGGELISKIFNFALAKQIDPAISEALDNFATNTQAEAEITMHISSGTKPL